MAERPDTHPASVVKVAVAILRFLAYTLISNSDKEERLIIIGLSNKRRLLVVIYTERGKKIRLISARKATHAKTRNMKNKTSQVKDDDMRPEYDFTSGVRGKYARELRENGYSIRVYSADGKFTEIHVLGEKTVVLAPDVSEYFPDSETVNHALRTLLSLVPEKRKAAARKRRDIRGRHAVSKNRARA